MEIESIVFSYSDNDDNDEFAYEEAIAGLTSLMNSLSSSNRWFVKAKNIGWRRLSGSAQIEANDGQELLRKILPQTECSWDAAIQTEEGKKYIKIINCHHDSPTGETYEIFNMEDED